MTWTLAAHWAAAAPGRMHTVLYEDLVAHPEEAIREVLAACGLAFEPSVLQFHDSAREQGIHTASQAQVIDFGGMMPPRTSNPSAGSIRSTGQLLS